MRDLVAVLQASMGLIQPYTQAQEPQFQKGNVYRSPGGQLVLANLTISRKREYTSGFSIQLVVTAGPLSCQPGTSA